MVQPQCAESKQTTFKQRAHIVMPSKSDDRLISHPRKQTKWPLENWPNIGKTDQFWSFDVKWKLKPHVSSLQCERPGLGFLKWKKVGERNFRRRGRRRSLEPDFIILTSDSSRSCLIVWSLIKFSDSSSFTRIFHFSSSFSYIWIKQNFQRSHKVSCSIRYILKSKSLPID